MIYSKLDIFSSQFNFNIDNQQRKRGTLFGTILSLLIVIVACTYLIYVIQLFFTNQIEPVFRTQSFITEDKIDVPLSSSMVGFRFEVGQDSGNESISQNKTYLVYLAYFYYNSPTFSKFIPLNVTECDDKNLQGFYCLDLSPISNYTLSLSTKDDIKSLIQILTYGCLDTDSLKTTIPDNCATQSEIDSMINGVNSFLRFKLYTSQYNTTSQQVQVNYRNAVVYTSANQAILTQLKTQRQVTKIKEGLFVQSTSQFSSPIAYVQQDQGFDREYALNYIQAGAYSTAMLFLDEIVQQIQVQYPTLPQIFAQINSTFTVLMVLGIFGRYFSQKSIDKEFFMLFLKNLYQVDFLKLVSQNQSPQSPCYSEVNYLQSEINQQDYERKGDQISEDNGDTQSQQIQIPAFTNKQKCILDIDQTLNANEINFDTQASKFNQNLKNEEKFTLQLEKYSKNEEEKYNLEFHKFKRNKNLKSSLQFNNFNIQESIIQGSPTSQMSGYQKDQSVFFSNSVSQKLTFKNKQPFFLANKKEEKFDRNEKFERMRSKYGKILDEINNPQVIDQFYKTMSKMKKKNQQSDENTSLRKIEQQMQKDLNILTFFKEIIFLKKAISMLLKKDQLAALHLLGFSSNFLNEDILKFDCSLQQIEKEKQLSHYEMQYYILKSEKFQKEYIEEFFLRCSQDETNLSNLDSRILASIKSCYKI